MLTVRWDTVVVAVVIGLVAFSLIAPALVRVYVASRIRDVARRTSIRNLNEFSARRRRPVAPPAARLALHRDGEAAAVPPKPQRRQVS